MFNKTILNDVINYYKRDFVEFNWEREEFKWQAVKIFQDNWNIDAKNFSEMLTRSLSGTSNLLNTKQFFPMGMIIEFAEIAPEEVRNMFRALFDESRDVVERILEFKNSSTELLAKYRKDAKNHYQTENSISTYLWLKFPDKYYIYKHDEVKAVAKELGSDYVIKKGYYESNLRNFYNLYDEICDYIKTDNELINLLQSHLTESHYKDTEFKTLTVDIGFYISRYYNDKKKKKEETITIPVEDADINTQYWWLNANPKIWSLTSIDVGEEQFYTLCNENGNKRRIYQNFLDVKAGDKVIGYESNPAKQIVALCEITAANDGEKIQFKKTESLTSPIAYSELKDMPELKDMEFFVNPNGSLFKLTKEEYGVILDIVRDQNPVKAEHVETDKYTKSDFLSEVYISEEKYATIVSVLKNKKNIILQGAPGVGKTFAAKRLAYSVMGVKDESRVKMIQFHQNYSYEDFIMGYKPSGDGYELKNGIFYQFCITAANQPDKDFFFIIDEINRGNMSKIFGELLMMIESDHRSEKTTLPYNGALFSVSQNLYIIGMMNTADRSIAMIDYALRRRFSFIEMEPCFDSEGFTKYQQKLNNPVFDKLIDKIKQLNKEIADDKTLGKGFCIGHSYFCNWQECTISKMREVVEFDIIPTLNEYWFDDAEKCRRWTNELRGVLNDAE
ncbi:MAG: EVE domain-containing protein [Clostridia bacterium]|nr:EVE domain-containing protein [Clostridia bacterium]